MPAPTIGRRPAWPPQAATIDRSHPLAAGLKMYVMPGISKVDLVDGSALTVAAGSVSRVSSPFGPAGLSASGRLTIPNIARFAVSTTDAAFTIFAVGKGEGINDACVFDVRAATPIIEYATNNGTIRFRTRTDGGNLDDLVATCAINTNVLCCTGTWKAGVKVLYVDRAASVTSTSAGSPVITAMTDAALYGDGNAVNTTSQTVVVCAFWNRALSAGEVAWLHANPFCMLRG